MSQHKLPDTAQDDALPPFYYLTDKRMPYFQTTPREIFLIINSLKVNKATGPDGISNRMLKLSAPSICQSLAIVFNQIISTGIFPIDWKKANVSPIFKSVDRQLVENYRPISLLSNVSKVFERVIYKKMYEFLNANGLLTSKNAGYKKNYSTVSQLLSITQKIYEGLDNNKHIRMVFLDASKAFDRVWHSGLFYKLAQLGIENQLLQLLRSYLKDRTQRVVINGFSSSWKPVSAGVPQGSILGPLLFLVYTNDIVNYIQSDINLYADDTSLLHISSDPIETAMDLNSDLDILQR